MITENRYFFMSFPPMLCRDKRILRDRWKAGANPLVATVVRFDRAKARLEQRLQQAETIIEFQKVSGLLGIPLRRPGGELSPGRVHVGADPSAKDLSDRWRTVPRDLRVSRARMAMPRRRYSDGFPAGRPSQTPPRDAEAEPRMSSSSRVERQRAPAIVGQ